MKILLLTTLVAFAAADVSHIQTTYGAPPTSYGVPQTNYPVPVTSYNAPQASVLGNIGADVGSIAGPDLSLPSISGAAQFKSAYTGGTIQTFDNGAFSTPRPLTSDELAQYTASSPSSNSDLSGFQVSTPSSVQSSNIGLSGFQVSSPSAEQQSSSFQLLSKLSQPSVSTIGFNSAQLNSDASINSGLGQSSFSGDSQLNSGLGLGGGIIGSNAGSFDSSQLNAGLGLGGSQFISKSSGGSLSDSFGVSVDAAGSTGNSGQGSLEPEVSKNLYFFDAPQDDEDEAEAKISYPPVAPKKSYKIIFIKAPTYRNQQVITIPAQPPTEEKTLVYVLVKKPEKKTQVRFEQSPPAVPSKPEVFFIKYRTQKEAEDAVAEIQNKHGATGQVIANLPAGQTISHIQIPTDIHDSDSVSIGGSKSGFQGYNTFGSNSLGSVTPGITLRTGIEPNSFGSVTPGISLRSGVEANSGVANNQITVGQSTVAPAVGGSFAASFSSSAGSLSASSSVDSSDDSESSSSNKNEETSASGEVSSRAEEESEDGDAETTTEDDSTQ